MNKYTVWIALVVGITFTSLLSLALNTPPVVQIPAYLLLAPGGILGAIIFRSDMFDAAPALILIDTAFYSGLSFVVLAASCRNMKATALRSIAIKLTMLALIVASLACVPAWNPLWPRGMSALAKEELELQDSIRTDMSVSQVRAVLRSRQIKFQEQVEAREENVLTNSNLSINAAAGDRVLFSRVPTNASKYPCGYDIQIELIFGQNEKLKQRYIHSLPICP